MSTKSRAKLLLDILMNFGNQFGSSSANRQDPTLVEKTTMFFHVKDHVVGTIIAEEYGNIPQPEFASRVFEVELVSSWGTSVSITEHIDVVNRKQIAENLLDENKWHWDNKSDSNAALMPGAELEDFIEYLLTRGAMISETEANNIILMQSQKEATNED